MDIFEQIASTSEPKEELGIFTSCSLSKNINWMLRTSNVLFNGGGNMKQCFLHEVRQILNVVGSQIEIERIFLCLKYLLTLGDVVCKLKILKN